MRIRTIWLGVLNLVLLSYAAFAQQLGSQHFAAINFSDNITTKAELQSVETAFSRPGWLPTHPLYFVKRMRERARLLSASRKEQPQLHFAFAKLRLTEAGALMRLGNTGAAKAALAEFDREITAARSAGAVDDDWIVGKSTLFLEVTDVPPEMRPMIKDALAMLRGSA